MEFRYNPSRKYWGYFHDRVSINVAITYITSPRDPRPDFLDFAGMYSDPSGSLTSLDRMLYKSLVSALVLDRDNFCIWLEGEAAPNPGNIYEAESPEIGDLIYSRLTYWEWFKKNRFFGLFADSFPMWFEELAILDGTIKARENDLPFDLGGMDYDSTHDFYLIVPSKDAAQLAEPSLPVKPDLLSSPEASPVPQTEKTATPAPAEDSSAPKVAEAMPATVADSPGDDSQGLIMSPPARLDASPADCIYKLICRWRSLPLDQKKELGEDGLRKWLGANADVYHWGTDPGGAMSETQFKKIKALFFPSSSGGAGNANIYR